MKPNNVVVLIGRITADPELRTTQSGLSVTSFSVAIYKGKDKGADFIDVVAWRDTADFVTRYFNEGSMISVVGELQTRMYEDKQGNKRKAVEVVASGVSFCGGKNDAKPAEPTYEPARHSDYPEEPADDDELPF